MKKHLVKRIYNQEYMNDTVGYYRHRAEQRCRKMGASSRAILAGEKLHDQWIAEGE